MVVVSVATEGGREVSSREGGPGCADRRGYAQQQVQRGEGKGPAARARRLGRGEFYGDA